LKCAGALQVCTDNERVTLHCIRALGRLLPLQKDITGSLPRTLQAILDSLLTGSYKAQWNACYALSSLLSAEGVGARMMRCTETPLILDQLLHILITTPNFKSRMHAAASLAKVASREQCCGCYDAIHAALSTAVDESGGPAGAEDCRVSSVGDVPHGSLDFKSLPGMRLQLQQSLEHFQNLPERL